MAPKGRGRNYSPARRLAESALERLYASGWPARLPFAQAPVRAIHHPIEVKALAKGPIRVAFASDLHAGPTTPARMLEQALEHIRAFEPHLVLLGGDYVLFGAEHADRLVPLLATLRPPLGAFAVLGNHDLWADERHIMRALNEAGVRVLVNEVVHVNDELSIGGLDDAWAGAPDYGAAFQGAAAVHLVLMHGPDHVPGLAPYRFTAAFCGHTHGGHIAAPGGIPLHGPTPLSRRYSHGRFELPGGPLLVSRGVGHVEAPLRAFAPADVLCVTLGVF